MKLLTTALILVLTGCATGPTREELEKQQDLSMRQYEDCLRVSTNHYLEISRGTATEVAEAVLAECDPDLEKLRQAEEAVAMTAAETPGAKEEAIAESHESAERIREGMRGTIIGRVLREG